MMASTYGLAALLQELIIPLLIALPSSTTIDATEEQTVDLIELNHFYDDLGRHAYDQVIFYEWSHDYRRFHVVAWCLVEGELDRMPKRDHVRGGYAVNWQERDTHKRHRIHAQLFRETWSQTDPERANKRWLDEKYRLSLVPKAAVAR